MKGISVIILLLCGLIFSVSQAQQPTPAMIVVQAATAQPAAAPVIKPVANNESDAVVQSALKCLQETKAANVEILKKQEEMLQRLDDLQKASDQLRIFSKRSGG